LFEFPLVVNLDNQFGHMHGWIGSIMAMHGAKLKQPTSRMISTLFFKELGV
jgi:hypothetical protein